LDLQSLIAATKVCTEWHGAVATMAPGHFTIHDYSVLPIHCAIGKHFRTLDFFAQTPLDTLAAFIAIAPRLTTVQVCIRESHGCMNICASLSHLTHLVITSFASEWIHLSPLTSCRLLKRLRIDVLAESKTDDLTDDQVQEVRALGHLDSFEHSALAMNTENLRRVLTTPHSLHWQNIGFILKPESVSFLPALPSLTRLYGSCVSFSHTVLAMFPHLTCLEVIGNDGLSDALDGCHSLNELIVHLPDSLQWAHHPMLRSTLRTLTLKAGWCAYIAPEHLTHLAHLTTLNHLTVYNIIFEKDIRNTPEFAALQMMPTLKTITLIE
jgi:hypothetical protein